MKHTPGPWKVKSVKETYGANAGVTYRYVIGDDPTDYIAECFPCRTPDTTNANARLIAAAPELLAACEAMVKVLDVENLTMQTIERQARAAIAKATGEA